MKKLITIAVVLGMLAGFISPAVMAATVSAPAITVGANVVSAVGLEILMKKNRFDGATITTMDFGTLVQLDLVPAGSGKTGLRSSPTSTTGTGAVDMFISANSQGAPYSITSVGTPVSSGANVLPAGNLTVVPVYAAEDNGGAALPAGAALGTAGSWVGTKTLFTSGPTGASRTVEAFYSITDDPAAGATGAIPVSQPAGAYTGTVTITMTT